MIGLAFLATRVLPWTVRTSVALSSEATERAGTLARARAALAAAPAERDSLAEVLQGIVGLAPRLVDGRTSAEAQASLSGLMSFAASRHALKLVRVDPLPDSAGGAFHRVAVRVECEGDVAGLTALLKALETGDPLLTVSALAVQAPEPWPRPGAPEVLRIELTVAGWYLARDAGASGGGGG
jgi:hypothetical protein